MFEIVFLGTSASAPSVHRGLSSQVVLHDEFRFLIDCGEGTQRQILKSGIGFKRLNRMAGNPLLRQGLRLIGRPELEDYFRDYHQSVAEGLADWEERTRCPVNDRLCDEAAWLGQTVLLGSRADMDDIAAATRKIQAAAPELARA